MLLSKFTQWFLAIYLFVQFLIAYLLQYWLGDYAPLVYQYMGFVNGLDAVGEVSGYKLSRAIQYTSLCFFYALIPFLALHSQLIARKTKEWSEPELIKRVEPDIDKLQGEEKHIAFLTLLEKGRSVVRGMSAMCIGLYLVLAYVYWFWNHDAGLILSSKSIYGLMGDYILAVIFQNIFVVFSFWGVRFSVGLLDQYFVILKTDSV